MSTGAFELQKENHKTNKYLEQHEGKKCIFRWTVPLGSNSLRSN